MIPRFKPYLDKKELLAALRPAQDAVERFEAEFARTFEAKYALAFPYGRSALWAFLKTMDIQDAEIIMPAYTCSVVAHAIVLSGNSPRFVDITLHDYNMDLDQVAEVINERTQAIIATHLFGYPLNVNRLSEIVRDAENRYGHKIWVIQDCAHSFGAKWKGKLVCNASDAALFGLNISKMMTSIFGGMLTTNDEALATRLKEWRDRHFIRPGVSKSLRRQLYLVAVYAAFNEHVYGFVNWLQESTPLLDQLTKAYHLDEKIHFPPDYLDQILGVEAQVGLAQLCKYPEIVRRRQKNALYYSAHVPKVDGWTLPPLLDGATFSHYVIRVPNRLSILKALQSKGIQLGQLIEYSIPHLNAYKVYAADSDYPNSRHCSEVMINLPVHADIGSREQKLIVKAIVEYTTTMVGVRRQ